MELTDEKDPDELQDEEEEKKRDEEDNNKNLQEITTVLIYS